MKTDKKKVVFGSIVIIILIFIISYTVLVFLNDEAGSGELDQPTVPRLEETGDNYSSRREAVDALREKREAFIPSVYPEEFLDSLGQYDPELKEEQRALKVDRVLNRAAKVSRQPVIPELPVSKETSATEEPPLAVPDFRAQHLAFFQAALNTQSTETDAQSVPVRAEVHGRQKLRSGDRIELILREPFQVGNTRFPKNTLVYGFIQLRKNRVLIRINHIGKEPVELRAYDLQDRSEGIYVRNSFRAQGRKEIIGDVVQDISIAGIPQIGGIKSLFRKSNRTIKVSIMDQYQLILKP